MWEGVSHSLPLRPSSHSPDWLPTMISIVQLSSAAIRGLVAPIINNYTIVIKSIKINLIYSMSEQYEEFTDWFT